MCFGRASTAAKRTFQSLVGRLETDDEIIDLDDWIVFQSLVGRLETLATPTTPYSKFAFQSLVGRLETNIAVTIRSIV